MSETSLTNHLLIAMPSLADPNFSQTVTLICEHTDKGALGIVVNKPLPMKLSDVLAQMNLEPRIEHIAAQPVLRGGPVSTDRGFVLHRPGGQWDHSHKVSDIDPGHHLARRARRHGARRRPGRCVHRARLRRAGKRASSSARSRTTPGSPCPSTPAWSSTCPTKIAGSAAWRFLGIDVDTMSPSPAMRDVP